MSVDSQFPRFLFTPFLHFFGVDQEFRFPPVRECGIHSPVTWIRHTPGASAPCVRNLARCPPVLGGFSPGDAQRRSTTGMASSSMA